MEENEESPPAPSPTVSADDSVNKVQQSVIKDPICESYRSIIDVINRTSDGFKEGKKWKCVADSYPSSSSYQTNSRSQQQQQNHHNHRRRKQQHLMSHSKTVDERQLTDTMGSQSGLNRGGGARGRKLVRQKATTTHLDDSSADEPLLPQQSSSQVLTVAEVVDERPRIAQVHRGLPARQWTVDTCTGIRTSFQQEGTTAYLLRPVSRSSLVNAGTGTGNEDQIRRVSPASDHRPRTPLNHHLPSMTGSMDSGGRVRLFERAVVLPHHNRHRRHLIKQRTSESAPTTQHQQQQQQIFGGSSRCLPRQHSNASAYSAVMPTSYSHQGITLVRGASCSLVDIPTYLGPSVAATGGVELAQLCDVGKANAAAKLSSSTALPQAPLRPRLQLDLTKKTKSIAKDNARKTQWTVLCVSVTLLTLSVTLVGTMLSVGSQYQEMVIAKQWETFTKNQSRKSNQADELEPFVIVPDEIVVTNSSGSSNGTTDSLVATSTELVPPIILLTADTRDLLDITKHKVKKTT